MDVSRIGAFNPSVKINWQILTAREILRFNDLGVQVPDEYLIWANDFLNSVYDGDKDKVTFEMAHIKSQRENEGIQVTDIKQPEVVSDLNEGEDAYDDSVGDVKDLSQKSDLQVVQPENQQPVEEGTNLRNQAKSSIKKSKSLAKSTLNSENLINADKNKSNDEIALLDQEMRILISNADNLRQ